MPIPTAEAESMPIPTAEGDRFSSPTLAAVGTFSIPVGRRPEARAAEMTDSLLFCCLLLVDDVVVGGGNCMPSMSEAGEMALDV